MLCIMAKRRMCEEANSLDEVNSPVANVTVHGAVTAVSPVKKGKRSIFFDGMLADHTARVRLFGFDSFQQRKLDELHQRRLPAEISDCEVKRSRYHEGFEVMLKNSSKIKESTREDLDVDRILENEPSAEYPETAEITLEQLPDIQLFRKVQVCVKAIIVHDAVQLSNKTKQDIIVADARSTAKLTLWEDHVGSLEEGRCYRLVDFVVRIWQGTKYLSRGESSQLLIIDDIGAVAAVANKEEEITYKNVTIIGVPQLDCYKSCLKCKARVQPGNLPLGSCSSQDCGMSQRIDLCSDYSAAKLMILYIPATGQSKIAQVQVTGRRMLMLIASCRPADDAAEIEITQDLLLRAPPISWVRVIKSNRIVTACSSFVTCNDA